MTTFQTTINTILGFAWVGVMYTGFKGFVLYDKLRNKNLIGTKWSGTPRLKDLRKLEANTTDVVIKKQARNAVLYLRTSWLIVWASALLIFVLFFLNAILKWL